MKSTELLLTQAILTDIGVVLHTSVGRDWETIQSRFKHEGLSFLTITLPSFCTDFESCLEQGKVDSTLFRSFSKDLSRGSIPRFLSGMTSLVFDGTGQLRTDASIEAIDGVRQLCLAFKKLKMECTDDRKRKAIKSFHRCEEDLRSFRPRSWDLLGAFQRFSGLLFGGVFTDVERELKSGELRPKHGPGSVFERLSTNGKYRWKVWTQRLDRYFPVVDNLYVNTDHFLQDGKGLSFHSGKDCVRVVFVPKTLKSPRVIAIEPTHNQYIQQSLMAPIVNGIEGSRYTSGSLLFNNSSVNGRRACSSSKDRKFATLDLSEASDRIHAGLAYQLFRGHPYLARAIYSCRSKYAILPDGVKIPLIKFASMGSALCFPIEAMVFYTICVMSVFKVRGLRVSHRNLLAVKREISVFGDDLIIPVDVVSEVKSALASAGLKVNIHKTFVNGYFRESCGVDAYAGHNVTPVYVRQLAPSNRRDADRIVSWISTANLLYRKGYWTAAQCMRTYIESRIGTLPHVHDTSSLIGHYSVLGTYSITKWNKTLHRFECRGFTTAIKKKDDRLSSYDRMLKFFLTRKAEPIECEDFDKSAIRSSLHLKQRWTTPF